MAKISMLAIGGHGHVNPALAVSEQLAQRGHDVDFWATEEFRGAAETAKVTFRAYDSLLAKMERPSTVTTEEMLRDVPRKLLNEAKHALAQIDAPLSTARPDLLIYDNMAAAGRILAEARGIPAACLFTSYAGNARFNLLSSMGPPPAESLREFENQVSELTRAYGTRPFPFTELFGHAEALNIVCMPRAWQPEGEFFDDRFVFVGPCVGTRSETALPTGALGRDPLLFISLGTAWNERPEFYADCFKAFGGSAWNVVMAVGTKVDIAALGEVPSNFTVLPHVPQVEVLKRARAFVTHGGMNSTMEALSFGVPLVVLPQMFEQAVTARRVGELGVGITLSMDEVTPSSLRTSVDHAEHDPQLRRNAMVIQKAIRTAGGAKRACDAIEAHLAALQQALSPDWRRSRQGALTL